MNRPIPLGGSRQAAANDVAGAGSSSPGRQASLMLVLIVSMAVCYPLIKAGLVFAPPLRFAVVRTMLGGFVLLLVLAVRRSRCGRSRAWHDGFCHSMSLLRR